MELNDSKIEVATFAPGCFWCLESVMQATDGVVDAVTGYAGGTEANPTYHDVYLERTGHRESVQIKFNPEIISYEKILEIFWNNIDPTDPDGQFYDRGFSYTTAIFYHNEEQQKLAEKTKRELEESSRFNKPIVTSILPYTTFFEAEAAHQDFFIKNPGRYKQYSHARDELREAIWREIQNESTKH